MDNTWTRIPFERFGKIKTRCVGIFCIIPLFLFRKIGRKDADKNDADKNDADKNDADKKDADKNDADKNDADKKDADKKSKKKWRKFDTSRLRY